MNKIIKLFGEELTAAMERVFDQQAVVGFAESDGSLEPLCFQESGGSSKLSLDNGPRGKGCLGCRLMVRLKKGEKTRKSWMEMSANVNVCVCGPVPCWFPLPCACAAQG